MARALTVHVEGGDPVVFTKDGCRPISLSAKVTALDTQADFSIMFWTLHEESDHYFTAVSWIRDWLRSSEAKQCLHLWF